MQSESGNYVAQMKIKYLNAQRTVFKYLPIHCTNTISHLLKRRVNALFDAGTYAFHILRAALYCNRLRVRDE